MAQVFHSDIELYYSEQSIYEDDSIFIEGEEFKHIVNVMRHKVGDSLHITDGLGRIHRCKIKNIEQKGLYCETEETTCFYNNASKIIFCLPRLKNSDRFEFALEKCVELGITRFIVVEFERSVAKGQKFDRWEKILVSAMKQSLRAFKPKISYVKKLSDIAALEGIKIFFDQKSDCSFESKIKDELKISHNREEIYLIFGPEGGFDISENRVMNDFHSVHLTGNRLRSETAVIAAAVLLSNLYQF